MSEYKKPATPDELSPMRREALAKIQARNDRRRKGILRGENFSEWEEYIEELEKRQLMRAAA